MCALCGFHHVSSKLAPRPAIRIAVVEVTRWVCEPCSSGCGSLPCRVTESMQFVPANIGVGEGERAGENTWTCESEVSEGVYVAPELANAFALTARRKKECSWGSCRDRLFRFWCPR